jgi:hypothetical protein
MFHRKEEVVLKVDCNSDSDESVDVMDSSSSERSHRVGHNKVQTYKLPNKGAVNMKRLDLPTTIKKNVKE